MANISVIQIIRKEGLDYKAIISQNSLFLKDFEVEYIVFDNTNNSEILKFIKNVSDVKYFRKSFLNLQNSFLESGHLAQGDNLIYLKSKDVLNIENLSKIEKERPNISKKNLEKINKIKNPNFKFDDFNLIIKDNKTIFEKVQIILSHYF